MGEKLYDDYLRSREQQRRTGRLGCYQPVPEGFVYPRGLRGEERPRRWWYHNEGGRRLADHPRGHGVATIYSTLGRDLGFCFHCGQWLNRDELSRMDISRGLGDQWETRHRNRVPEGYISYRDTRYNYPRNTDIHSEYFGMFIRNGLEYDMMLSSQLESHRVRR